MSIEEKRREGFEAWYKDNVYGGSEYLALKWLVREGSGYLHADPSDAWDHWNAALDSVVIELPEEVTLLDSNVCMVVEAIESAGLKVKS